MVRTATAAFATWAALALAAPVARVGERAARAGDPLPEAAGVACVIPAFLLDDDAGLRKVYDGIRKGLEEANLPRVCLKPVEPDDDATWASVVKTVAKDAPPVVFAVGPKAIARCSRTPVVDGAGSRIPVVYVDVSLVANGRSLVPPIDPVAPAAVVRGEVSVARWGEVLHALLPGRPRPQCLLPWSPPGPEAAAWIALAAEAARVDLVLPKDALAPGDAILDWAGPGPRRATDLLVEQARNIRVPLLSDDRGRFGRGAAVLVVPDGALLGRVAAEAARRLRDGEGRSEAIRSTVTRAEVWVDLEAADAERLKPSLPFLATADLLRRGLSSSGGAGGSEGPPEVPKGTPPDGMR